MRLVNACLCHWRNGVHGCRLGAATAQRWARRQRSRQQTGLIAAELTARGAELTYGSVTDRTVVADAVAGCDAVMHLAAAFREVEAVGLLVSRGESRRHADRWRGKLEGQSPKVRLLQHARYPRPHREPAGRRDVADRAGGLLSANQVRGRARARGVGQSRSRLYDSAADRDLRPGRSRSVLDALQTRATAARSRCSAAASRTTTLSISTTSSTDSYWPRNPAEARARHI